MSWLFSCDVCSSVRHLITFRDFFTSIFNMKLCGSISFSCFSIWFQSCVHKCSLALKGLVSVFLPCLYIFVILQCFIICFKMSSVISQLLKIWPVVPLCNYLHRLALSRTAKCENWKFRYYFTFKCPILPWYVWILQVCTFCFRVLSSCFTKIRWAQ